jgi:hypothetical protein
MGKLSSSRYSSRSGVWLLISPLGVKQCSDFCRATVKDLHHAKRKQVIYNEGWGQPSEAYDGVHNTSIDGILTELVRKIDPTRLIDSVTGWVDHGAGDFHVSPSCPPQNSKLTGSRTTIITLPRNAEHPGTRPPPRPTTQPWTAASPSKANLAVSARTSLKSSTHCLRIPRNNALTPTQRLESRRLHKRSQQHLRDRRHPGSLECPRAHDTKGAGVPDPGVCVLGGGVDADDGCGGRGQWDVDV